MRRLRSMKSLLAGVAVAVILLVNIFPVVAYGAIAPWHGHTWNGKTWEGNTWRGHSWDHFKWSGPKWNGSPWDGSPGNGKSWNGNAEENPWNANSGNGNSWSGKAGSRNSWNSYSWKRTNGYQGTDAPPYFDEFKKARRWYSWGVNTGIGGLSWGLGYKIHQRGEKFIIYGARDVVSRWNRSWAGKRLSRLGVGGLSNKFGKGLQVIYHNYRGIKGNTTWYNALSDNPIQKHMRIGTAVKSSLNNRFWTKSLKFATNFKGGGLISSLATLGADLWKYNPWGGGSKSNEGYLNSDFASAVITDGGIAAGTTVISSAVGAGTAVAIGAATGSVIPGLGTVVGAAVGLGIGFLMSTSWGQGVRESIKSSVKAILDGGWNLSKKGWENIKNVGSKVGHAAGDAWDWASGLF